jgi:hypothetical protein
MLKMFEICLTVSGSKMYSKTVSPGIDPGYSCLPQTKKNNNV